MTTPVDSEGRWPTKPRRTDGGSRSDSSETTGFFRIRSLVVCVCVRAYVCMCVCVCLSVTTHPHPSSSEATEGGVHTRRPVVVVVVNSEQSTEF